MARSSSSKSAKSSSSSSSSDKDDKPLFDNIGYVQKAVFVDETHIPKEMNQSRTRILNAAAAESGKFHDEGRSVVYWMQRDVRTQTNWAFHFAQHLASTHKVPLHVVHVLPPRGNATEPDGNMPPGRDFMDRPMTERHGSFYLGGLELVHDELTKKNVPLHLARPASYDGVGQTLHDDILEDLDPCVVVCDFSPLRHQRQWSECQLGPLLSGVPLWQVDAHNVVPVWQASEKRQVGARTLRPRIHNQLKDFTSNTCPKFAGNKHVDDKDLPDLPSFDKQECLDFLDLDESVPAVDTKKPGTKAAQDQFSYFVDNGLQKYDELCNDPNKPRHCSDMSPWLNHGHISYEVLLKAVQKLNKFAAGTSAFIEEGLIRRELSDNYVYYEPHHYDDLQAAAGWARETLEVHASDKREYLYSLDELESGRTHDDLWNAAQLQVVREGGMHGFLRMYWAKKILEWTESPEVALATAQYFNDKYALDGRDPNGFVGVGWSMMGIHDQGWKEREVFGKIRYMNYNGCKRKFDIAKFVARYEGASENADEAAKKHDGASKRGTKRKAGSSK